jgi:hypothetical protein
MEFIFRFIMADQISVLILIRVFDGSRYGCDNSSSFIIIIQELNIQT